MNAFIHPSSCVCAFEIPKINLWSNRFFKSHHMQVPLLLSFNAYFANSNYHTCDDDMCFTSLSLCHHWIDVYFSYYFKMKFINVDPSIYKIPFSYNNYISVGSETTIQYKNLYRNKPSQACMRRL